MAKIGFIGVGNMGGPMARNLCKAGHEVTVFDLSAEHVNAVVDAGAKAAASAEDAVSNAEVVVSMLPAGPHVSKVYGESVIGKAPDGALLIDCSTIDVETSRAVHEKAAAAGYRMVDAPVSGGVGGAEAGTLTLMCGGTEKAFADALPVLEAMGKNIVHCGGAGNGQAAKICNNMMLGIQMISVCEGFALADKLGLDHQKLFDVSSKASGQCWSLTTYCPVPGPVPTSPANRDYKPGFAAAMMLKDLRLAEGAAEGFGAQTALGHLAAELYQRFVDEGFDGADFSGIYRMISNPDGK